MKILTIFTCYNRKEKTRKCIETITKKNPNYEFTFVIADDGSTDGTYDMLQNLKKHNNIFVIRGDGNWFYSGGMNAGMNYALKNLSHDFDYMLMINDDVEFCDDSIRNMVIQSANQNNAIIVGATYNDEGEQSYGAIKYISGYKYRRLNLSEYKIVADAFNANCVLVPYKVFEKVGGIDSFYLHSLGDFDYGLTLKKAGYEIYQSKDYVGKCNNNTSKGTWTDVSLSRIERIRKKENVKGAPTKQWFYFLRKNFGIVLAIKGIITPYIRIILRR